MCANSRRETSQNGSDWITDRLTSLGSGKKQTDWILAGIVSHHQRTGVARLGKLRRSHKLTDKLPSAMDISHVYRHVYGCDGACGQ